MKIAICGSVQFAKEMITIRTNLEELGHIVVLPKNIGQYASGENKVEDKWDKMAGDLFRDYWNEIKNSDVILVVNLTKNGVENYIGGSTLIEISFAHILDKKIYLLNPVPEISYKEEVEAMGPIILNGDLSKISLD